MLVGHQHQDVRSCFSIYVPDCTNGDLGSPDRAGGNLRCPDRIEREVHARYGAVDNVRRIDAWRDLALRFGPMGWRPEQKYEDAKQKYKTRETRHKLLRCHGGYLHDAGGEPRVNSPNASGYP